MSRIVETVYNGRDNTIDLLLKADGVAVDLADVTRMIVSDVGGTFDVDEQTSPDAFDRDTGVTGKVILALGDENLTVGSYQVQLIVIDPTNPDGVVWGGNEFFLNVE